MPQVMISANCTKFLIWNSICSSWTIPWRITLLPTRQALRRTMHGIMKTKVFELQWLADYSNSMANSTQVLNLQVTESSVMALILMLWRACLHTLPFRRLALLWRIQMPFLLWDPVVTTALFIRYFCPEYCMCAMHSIQMALAICSIPLLCNSITWPPLMQMYDSDGGYMERRCFCHKESLVCSSSLPHQPMSDAVCKAETLKRSLHTGSVQHNAITGMCSCATKSTADGFCCKRRVHQTLQSASFLWGRRASERGSGGLIGAMRNGGATEGHLHNTLLRCMELHGVLICRSDTDYDKPTFEVRCHQASMNNSSWPTNQK